MVPLPEFTATVQFRFILYIRDHSHRFLDNRRVHHLIGDRDYRARETACHTGCRSRCEGVAEDILHGPDSLHNFRHNFLYVDSLVDHHIRCRGRRGHRRRDMPGEVGVGTHFRSQEIREVAGPNLGAEREGERDTNCCYSRPGMTAVG